MRISRALHPVFLMLALGLAVVLVGEFQDRQAQGKESGSAVDEILQVSAEGMAGDQTLFMVNSSLHTILVFKLDATQRLALNAYRNYKYDLALDEYPLGKGRVGAEATEAKMMVGLWEKSPALDEARKKEKGLKVDKFVDGRVKDSKGQTLLTAVGPAPGGGRQSGIADQVWITDKANQKILVYKMESNTLSLLAVRRYDYDERLVKDHDLSQNIPNYQSYSDVKKLVEDADKKKKEAEERK